MHEYIAVHTIPLDTRCRHSANTRSMFAGDPDISPGHILSPDMFPRPFPRPDNSPSLLYGVGHPPYHHHHAPIIVYYIKGIYR